MDIIEITNKIFNETPLRTEYIETGLTNDNYIVTLKNDKVVIRIPRKENAGLFDYALEDKILKLVANLNLEPPLLYYNKLTGVKCSRYIENVDTFEPKYIKRAAKLIKTLHDANLSSGKPFDIKHTFNMYKKRIKKPIYDTSFAHHYIDDLNLENIRLCHNDLVQGNLLFSDTKDYLIDFEYAGDNDPYFDIMSFITENDIINHTHRQIFYKEYFGDLPSPSQKSRLDHFEIVHHVLWCEWAMMMYESQPLPIYKEIADLKYKRLNECIRKNL